MPKDYTVTEVGPDVDLDTEDIQLADGTRLANEVADALVAKLSRLAPAPANRPLRRPRK